jgi:hypothetical protein
VHGHHLEGVAVEGDGLVQVGNGDAHVVDGGEEVAHAVIVLRSWARGHGL